MGRGRASISSINGNKCLRSSLPRLLPQRKMLHLSLRCGVWVPICSLPPRPSSGYLLIVPETGKPLAEEGFPEPFSARIRNEMSGKTEEAGDGNFTVDKQPPQLLAREACSVLKAASIAFRDKYVGSDLAGEVMQPSTILPVFRLHDGRNTDYMPWEARGLWGSYVHSWDNSHIDLKGIISKTPPCSKHQSLLSPHVITSASCSLKPQENLPRPSGDQACLRSEFKH